MAKNKRKRSKNDAEENYKRICKNPDSCIDFLKDLKYYLDKGVNCNISKDIMNKMIVNKNIEAIKILIINGYDLKFSLLKSVKCNDYIISKLLLKNGLIQVHQTFLMRHPFTLCYKIWK